MLGENTLYMRSNGIVGYLMWGHYERRRLWMSISDTIEELSFYRESKDIHYHFLGDGSLGKINMFLLFDLCASTTELAWVAWTLD
jgi:hypothetical protein